MGIQKNITFFHPLPKGIGKHQLFSAKNSYYKHVLGKSILTGISLRGNQNYLW